MKLTLIGHASVIVSENRSNLLTDPWFFGTAFNDSWSLLPEPEVSDLNYSDIDYLWISHEHPDHFHIPTLRSLPTEFKENVLVLFQKRNSDRLVKAMRQFGYTKFLHLENRRLYHVDENFSFYSYQCGAIDSSLAIIGKTSTILNVNDCQLLENDCKRMRKDIGKVQVILSQFSIAGFNGDFDFKKSLQKSAYTIVEKVECIHTWMNADVTVPIASFMYFSTTDNKFLNEFHNRPKFVHDFLRSAGKECIVLYPSEEYVVGKEHDTSFSLQRFDDLFAGSDHLAYSTSDSVTIGEIRCAFEGLIGRLEGRYPRFLLDLASPIRVALSDTMKVIEFSISAGSFSELEATVRKVDWEVGSQPLHFVFKFPFGFDTLQVSGRLFVHRNQRRTKFFKYIMILLNMEIYLGRKYLFGKQNVFYIWQRLRDGLLGQVLQRILKY